MLNVYFGDMPDAIYNTNIYFNNTYKDSWITKPLSREIIQAVDHSEVIDEKTIASPVFGNMSPKKLSGGVKTLLLIAYDKTKVFNASTCGDNCARFILEIARKTDITINLRHVMEFKQKNFKAHILNNDVYVDNYSDYLYNAVEFV